MSYREIRRATVWSYKFHRIIDGRVPPAEVTRPYEKLPIPTDLAIVHITLLVVVTCSASVTPRILTPQMPSNAFRNDALDTEWLKRQKRFSAKAENRGVVVAEAGSHLRRIDSCITQLEAQGPARTCNESKEEEKKKKIRFRVAGFGGRGASWKWRSGTEG